MTRILIKGERERPDPVVPFSNKAQQVGHEIARQHKCAARNAAGPDVFFNVGFAVEMRHFAQSSPTGVIDVDERGKYEVRDACFFGSVRHPLALGDLDGRLCCFPVVCDEEDGVGALDGFGDRGVRVQIGLGSEVFLSANMIVPQ